MSFTTDNRWSTGASAAVLPDAGDVVAMYAARWIDRNGRADILGDRQGFAYDRAECRDMLIALLSEEEPHANYAHVARDRDDAALIVDRDDAQVWIRRAGGYVYVDAWLWSEEYTTEQARIDAAPDGTIGQDRESYSDVQDRDCYTVAETCAYCGMSITEDDNGSWIDVTDGDGCSGDDDLNNENGVHTPTRLAD